MRPIAKIERGGAFRSGVRRFFYAMRPQPHDRLVLLRRARQAEAVDPIALTIMAVSRLGPARLRASFQGLPVTVAAPDPATAEIFRAALSQTAKEHPTDRLISVELTRDGVHVASMQDGRAGRR